jgi:hypothetical protein
MDINYINGVDPFDYPILDSPPIMEDKPIDSEDEFLLSLSEEVNIMPSRVDYDEWLLVKLKHLGIDLKILELEYKRYIDSYRKELREWYFNRKNKNEFISK